MRQARRLAVFVCALGLVGVTGAADYNDDYGGGDWNSPASWNPSDMAYPGSGDTATIDSETITVNLPLTGADRPDEIILDGGEMGFSNGYNVYSDAIRVKSASDLSHNNWQRSWIYAPLVDYDGSNTGVLTFNGLGSDWSHGLHIEADGSGFSGGWDIQSGILRATADGALGTGIVDINGGLLEIITADQTAASPPAVVNIHPNGRLRIDGRTVTGWDIDLAGGAIEGRNATLASCTVNVSADSIIRAPYEGSLWVNGGLAGSAKVTIQTVTNSSVVLNGPSPGFDGTIHVPAGQHLTSYSDGSLGAGSATVLIEGRLRAGVMNTLDVPITLDGGALTNENIPGWGPDSVTVSGTVNVTGACTVGIYGNKTMTFDGPLTGDGSIQFRGGGGAHTETYAYIKLNNAANDFDGADMLFDPNKRPNDSPGWQYVDVTTAGAAGSGTFVVYNNRLRTYPPSGTAAVLGSVPAVEVRGGTIELNTIEDQGNIHLYAGGALIVNAEAKATWTPDYDTEIHVHSGAILHPDLPLPTAGQIQGAEQKIYQGTTGLAGGESFSPTGVVKGLATLDNCPTISGTVNDSGSGIAFYAQPLRAIFFDSAELNTAGTVELNGLGTSIRGQNGRGYFGYTFKGVGNFSGTASTFDMNAEMETVTFDTANGLPTGVTLNVNAGLLHNLVADAIQTGAVVNINAGGAATAAAGDGGLTPLSTGSITVNAGGTVWMDGDWLGGGADWNFQPGATLVLDNDGTISNCPTEVNFVLTNEDERSYNTAMVLNDDTRITVCPGYAYSYYYDRGYLGGTGDITTTGSQGRIAMGAGWRLEVAKKVNFLGKKLIIGDTSDFETMDIYTWYGVKDMIRGPVSQNGMVHLSNSGNVIGSIDVQAGGLRVDDGGSLGGAATIDLAGGTTLRLDYNNPALATTVRGACTVLVGDNGSGGGTLTMSAGGGLAVGGSVGEMTVNGNLAFGPPVEQGAVALNNPNSSDGYYEGGQWMVSAAIDGNPGTAWCSYTQSEPLAAAFQTAADQTLSAGMTAKLYFDGGQSNHDMDQFRIAVTTADRSQFCTVSGEPAQTEAGDVGADEIWQVLTPISATSVGGNTLTWDGTGLITASGTEVDRDTYYATFDSLPADITGIRIDQARGWSDYFNLADFRMLDASAGGLVYAQLAVDVASHGGEAGVDHDLLTVTGTVNLANAELVVDLPLPSGLLDPRLVNAQVLTTGGTLSGEFVSVVRGAATDSHWDIGLDDVAYAKGTVSVVLDADDWTGFGGDADLSGLVNYLDLGVLATNYDLTGLGWGDGDFNFDGKVDYMDLGVLATNYDLTEGSGGAPVPAPAALALLGFGAVGLLRRRRP